MLFTVFTPTFNRAHTLHRVYCSLKKQSFKNFEWLVIDDGSEDNTAELFSKWQNEAEFPIYFIKQNNSGKHIAINKAVKIANGEFFLIADSDDEILPNALEIFYENWLKIEDSKREKFTGVTGLCVDENLQLIGDKFPLNTMDSSAAEINYIHRVKGEKWGFNRTSILAEHPFPSIGGIHFYPEGIIWHRIGRQYFTRYINVPLRLYATDAGNQLSERPFSKKTMGRVFYSEMLNDDVDYTLRAPFQILKIAVQGARFSMHQNDTIPQQLKRLTSLQAKFVWLVGMPIAYVIYKFDRFNSK